MRPCSEALEARRLLSGNVLATQEGDVLRIVGDGLPNEVKVFSGNAPDEVVVQGENQTLVNGTNQNWQFEGIHRVLVSLGAGDDTFKSHHLEIVSPTQASLSVDGGAGDDFFDVKATTLRAVETAALSLVGEISEFVSSADNTGNDSMNVADTAVIAEGGANAQAFITLDGDFNIDSESSGGNDSIRLDNTRVAASGVLTTRAGITIYGEQNAALFGSSTIAGGNDSIDVSNTTVTAAGGARGNGAGAIIYGEFNLAGLSEDEGSATVGGGNDDIRVSNFQASASGSDGGSGRDSAGLSVIGDLNQDEFFGGPVGLVIGGGDDRIEVANVTLDAADPLPFPGFGAGLRIFGEQNFTALPGDATVGSGDDVVSVSNVRTGPSPGEASPFGIVGIDTSQGDDIVDVRNVFTTTLSVSLGAGDDELWLLNNDFVSSVLDGGLGHDVLHAHNNTGPVVPLNFEETHVTP
jgi:hypothetical protein